jgi:hypothetical protein
MAVSAIEPIKVTYFTPAQQEGPYFPVTKPEDRDNYLVTVTGATSVPNGQILAFDGTVYDANGIPLVSIYILVIPTRTAVIPTSSFTEKEQPTPQTITASAPFSPVNMNHITVKV